MPKLFSLIFLRNFIFLKVKKHIMHTHGFPFSVRCKWKHWIVLDFLKAFFNHMPCFCPTTNQIFFIIFWNWSSDLDTQNITECLVSIHSWCYSPWETVHTSEVYAEQYNFWTRFQINFWIAFHSSKKWDTVLVHHFSIDAIFGCFLFFFFLFHHLLQLLIVFLL